MIRSFTVGHSPTEIDDSLSLSRVSTSGVELPLPRIERMCLREARLRMTALREHSSDGCRECVRAVVAFSSTFVMLVVWTIGVWWWVFVWMTKSFSNWITSFIGSHGRKLLQSKQIAPVIRLKFNSCYSIIRLIIYAANHYKNTRLIFKDHKLVPG